MRSQTGSMFFASSLQDDCSKGKIALDMRSCCSAETLPQCQESEDQVYNSQRYGSGSGDGSRYEMRKRLSMLWANESDVFSRSVMLGLVERLECLVSRALSGDISSLRLPAFSSSAISISWALISTESNVKIEASLPHSSSVFRRKLETPFHDDKFARAVGCKVVMSDSSIPVMILNDKPS